MSKVPDTKCQDELPVDQQPRWGDIITTILRIRPSTDRYPVRVRVLLTGSTRTCT